MIKQQKKILNISIHITVWICFFLLPYIFSPQPKDISQNISRHLVVLYIVINIFLLAFYYFNTLLLIPTLLFQKKYVLYLIIVSVCFIAFLYTPREITHKINGTTTEMIHKQFQDDYKQRLGAKEETSNTKNKNKIPNKALKYFPGSFVVFLLVLTIGVCAQVIAQWKKSENTKEYIQHEKTVTELSFLKSQIRPHFFFNTLNNIYSLAVIQSDKTPDAVLKLSSIMRYMLTETQADKTLLANEVQFIRNYIDLQLMRLTDKVKVNFDVKGYLENNQIAPMLFIPFIENAFKYGISTKENSDVHIELTANNNNITFKVFNTILRTDNNIIEPTGIGINNVRRRLDLLYPNKHTLLVSETENKFIVHLEIDLT
ncbi:MAG: sensor histidine kinase [Chitinophagaceae bacterium]|nr:sensor histidine kinase [Chitinophagaceae bacterium]MCW5904973.1 sensor histidine kinase [Chitinophagaceae bacterium]